MIGLVLNSLMSVGAKQLQDSKPLVSGVIHLRFRVSMYDAKIRSNSESTEVSISGVEGQEIARITATNYSNTPVNNTGLDLELDPSSVGLFMLRLTERHIEVKTIRMFLSKFSNTMQPYFCFPSQVAPMVRAFTDEWSADVVTTSGVTTLSFENLKTSVCQKMVINRAEGMEFNFAMDEFTSVCRTII